MIKLNKTIISVLVYAIFIFSITVIIFELKKCTIKKGLQYSVILTL